MSFMFKKNFSLEERRQESARVMAKHPDRIPVICEKHERASVLLPQVDKYKYLVPNDLTIGQFIYVIRKRIHLTPEKAIYLFIDGIIPQSNETLFNIYHTHRDRDGFLYISYTNENTFGFCDGVCDRVCDRVCNRVCDRVCDRVCEKNV